MRRKDPIPTQQEGLAQLERLFNDPLVLALTRERLGPGATDADAIAEIQRSRDAGRHRPLIPVDPHGDWTLK